MLRGVRAPAFFPPVGLGKLFPTRFSDASALGEILERAAYAPGVGFLKFNGCKARRSARFMTSG